MSQENVEVAGRVLATLSRRDVSRLIALTDPEVEWHSFFAEVALGKGGGYRGHDGIRQYVSDLNDAWEIVRADVDDALGVDDVALLVGRIHYRGAWGLACHSSSGVRAKGAKPSKKPPTRSERMNVMPRIHLGLARASI